MRRIMCLIVVTLVVACIAALAGAQYYRGRGRSGYGDREIRSIKDLGDRGGVALWDLEPGFKSDVFTFCRVRYASNSRRSYSGGGWSTDVPDSDLNLSFRLQQLTSLKVDPWGRIVELTDPELFDYPFIYIVEPGRLEFTDEEVACLRRYLLNGGFLMVDDFWGEEEGDNFYAEIARVFPDHDPVELPLEHPIFHCVFDFKEKPQIPGVHAALRNKGTGITWEREDAKHVDYRGIFDDKGRMMVMVCHNTDTGDGWEEEGTDEWYFHEFSEKKGYPLGINIIYYAMTH